MVLNPQQDAAARAPAGVPLKIIAGAGTGKTETLAARYVELVRSGLLPQRIALLTFTEDAAATMRARVMQRLATTNLGLPSYTLLDPWIGTFHWLAMRLLRQHGFLIGLPPTLRLLADEEQAELWQQSVAAVEALRGVPADYTPLDHGAYRWDSDETWHKVQAVFQALRRGGGVPGELAPHAQLAAGQQARFEAHRAQLVPLVEHCWHAYTAHVWRSGVLDYDELLRAAQALLEANPALSTILDAVLVDEFQDTNRSQLALLSALQPGFEHTTVVGDPRQAIYGWNAARAETIYRFPFAGQSSAHALSANYRSHPAILRAANMALHGSELGALPPLTPPDTSEMPGWNMAGLLAGDDRAQEPVVSLHLVPTIADEAQLVVAQIQRLHAHGVAYNDMAILLRARTQLALVRAALLDAGVPFVTNGGTGFFDIGPCVSHLHSCGY